MSFDVICLIAEWAPAVAACRASHGTDFYWDAPESPDGSVVLPFAIERWRRGFDFIEAGFYYEILRPQLPGQLRDEADAFLGCIYDDLGQGCPEPPEDLADDAGIELEEYETHYSMRPAMVRAVLERARSVSWPGIEQAAVRAAMPARTTRYDVRDMEHFRRIVGMQETWLAEAARTGRGLIVMLSR
ncbi:hypothetical protein OG946_15100 [Streptomyces sp. NBC_01808]|uniref:hypothetical protein n=1 Tax=Streptomyces sp. NBC_01808 TaxID=2975947 RepID=UPI002DD8FB39|nr:hypothetical protein [Streptomyces sp. NBC_01808]WSA38586.1 hypothetical protein OG946_15100 [Streptomyces sp. NBC_01808]